MTDLPLRTVKHDIEIVFTKIKFDIDKFITTIAAIALIAAQLAIAIQFGIPASRQYSAQGRDPEPRRQVKRAIGNEPAAPKGALRRERAGR